MKPVSEKDKGGRRFPSQRRSRLPVKPVLEKRAFQERRSGLDRRTNPDPVIRITGDERRRVFRDLGRG